MGEADGMSSRLVGVLFIPILTVVFSMFLMLVPSIDPKKENIARFRSIYNIFILIFAGFLLYLHTLTIIWNLNMRFNMLGVLAPGFGLLIFYSGVLISHAQRNFLIGIRTPWTLSSDFVWEKTHRLGGLLFRLSGLAAALGILLPQHAIMLLMVPVLLASITTVVYSYVLYRKVGG
jgi:uncharacterized membrane protein